MKKINKKDWKEVGESKDARGRDGNNVIFFNGLTYVPVPCSLVKVIRQDAYDAGVQSGIEQERRSTLS